MCVDSTAPSAGHCQIEKTADKMESNWAIAWAKVLSDPSTGR